MNLLTNKDIRRLLGAVTAALILLIISGLIFSQVIVHDFKNQMLTRDYETAGYLLEHGAIPSDVAAAFTVEKTEQEFSRGRNILQTLGYTAEISNRLLPDANAFLFRYRLFFVLLAVLLANLIFMPLFLYLKRQQKAIEKASISINAFMGGDTTSRIDSEEEGDLSKLFATVNAMATSLNAHIKAEKNTKKFLKDTIGDISHQLKTPLAALKMYNEIIQEESANEDTVKKFSIKSASALERMEILIKNLLKITKLDAGTIELNKKNENIRALIQKSVLLFETRAEQEQKTITLRGADDTALYCAADWMTEAIGNLVKNALDHTETGGKIKITWQETPAVTKILVTDNGKGIHPEDIHHIFKRFYRSRFSQDTEGIGLGLPLSKATVEAHNGTISVDSELGKGSTFTLDFLYYQKV
ncbi:MAG: HAMP domain-containing sensor histidine kinase [Syntrophomonadaceae bacterium]|nr:HAMP domain-containing sensor histidine kinase [Syntrophomonadaceae bacterium]